VSEAPQQKDAATRPSGIFTVIRRSFIIISMFACIVLAAGYMWSDVIRTASGPHSQAVLFVLEKGAGTNTIKHKLYRAGVIAHPFHYYVHARLQGRSYVPKAGEYEIPAGASLADISALFHKGDVYQRRLVIPEGWRSFDVMEAINQADGMISVILRPPPEGSVLPNTYFYHYGMDRRALLAQMQAMMEMKRAEIWAYRADKLPYKTLDQLVVMASLIEKETGHSGERGLVSSVFVNRLRKGMRLQSDPTVAYGFAKDGIVPITLTKKHLASPHRWNTYRHKGLPPTPIANPGEDALIAAAQPEKSNYFYFVANGAGGHMFAKTLAEHNRNVRTYRSYLKRQKQEQGQE